MGVSTRGIKFKFYVGETVLCYEPDPTKAKVLYESRVLDLVPGSDARGKKRAEYLIHFLGWNSSWDRCVREDCILPYTDENRELQYKLARDAAVSIKGRRLTLIKDESNSAKTEPKKTSDASASDTSEDEEEKEIVINIPEVLKVQLEEDWRCINKKNKLVAIPCYPNVVGILEDFVKHSAAKMLRASPPRNGRQTTEDAKDRLGLYKEAADGLRVCFDFHLPTLLLYGQERRQHSSSSPHRHPHIPLKVEPCSSESEECLPSPSFKEPITIKQEPPPTSPPRPIIRRGRPPRNTPKVVENGIPQVKTTTENTQTAHTLMGRKRKRGRPKTQPTRILRSGLKPTRGRPPSKKKPASNTPNTDSTQTRAKRKSTESSIEGSMCMRTIKQEPGTSREPRITRRSSEHARVAMETQLAVHPDTPSSSSTNHRVSELSNGVAGSRPLQELSDALHWRMLPIDVREETPPQPSLVYGAQHLLRLFVKLPDLISKMRIPDRRLRPLLDILNQFLAYLCEQKDRLFPPSAYVDSPDISQ